jgi:hypothetical protein
MNIKSLITHVCGGAAVVLTVALLGASQPGGAPPVQPAAPTKADVIKRMLQSVSSTPILRVDAKKVTDLGEFDIRSWMDKDRVHEEIRRAGKLEFALYVGEGRIQEFAPKASFRNGTEADNVLLEYDAGPDNSNNDWARLAEHSFACDALGVAGESWLKRQHPTVPEMFAENVHDLAMTEAVVDGEACYLFHAERHPAPNSTLVLEFYVDKAVCDPRREASWTIKDGKIGTKKVTDYHLEHIRDEAGVVWRLSPSALKK